MPGCVKGLLLVCNKFDKFENVGAIMQDSFHHMMVKVFCNHVFGIMIKTSRF